jgi:hypothetical protein
LLCGEIDQGVVATVQVVLAEVLVVAIGVLIGRDRVLVTSPIRLIVMRGVSTVVATGLNVVAGGLAARVAGLVVA